jgi:histidinol-phosphate aminotransferase
MWAEVCEARYEAVPLGDRFAYDAERFAAAIRERAPALVVLCLPNNPTGTELGVRETVRIAEAAAAAGSVLVIDEAYREFSGPEFDRTPLARDFANVILVRTCSKAFSAAGMRLGYLLASPQLAGDLKKMVPPFHVNLFTAVFGLALWERKDFFQERVRQIVAERERLARALERLPGIEVFPSRANFLLLRARDAEGLFRGLKERGILVREPGKDGPLQGCLRVNAGTPAENDRFLAAVAGLVGARAGSGEAARKG